MLISAPTTTLQIIFDLALVLTFPITLYILGFFKSEEINKAKEIARMVKKNTPSDIKRIFHEQVGKTKE